MRIRELVARFRKVRLKLVYIKEDKLKRTSKGRKKGSEENCWRKQKRRRGTREEKTKSILRTALWKGNWIETR